MRFTKRLLALLLAFVLAAPALTYAVSGEENDAGTNILPAEYVDFHTEAQAGYISDTVESYWSYAQGTKDTSQPNPVICDIAGDGFPIQSKYVFQKSDNPEFENAEIITISGVKNGQYKLYNTELGEHFYWRASTDAETIEQSPIHEVYITTDRWRNLFVYGVINLRDIGGWPSSLGENAYIRQGLYIRGGMPEGILLKGLEQAINLGLKTEIDLRDAKDINKPGPYIDGVEYHNIQLPSYIPNFENYFDGFKDEFRTVFELISEADEKPVYLHCWAGADRTGLVSYLLLTMLGVSTEDATRDYLLTNYGNYGERSLDVPAKWYDQLSNYEGDTKAEQAKNWLISKGMPEEQVEKIRSIFIENYDPEYKGYSLEPSSWAKEEVEACIKLGLVPTELQEGYDLPITRGQVSVMIMRLLEKASWRTSEAILHSAGVEIDEDAFEDTKDSSILAANALGIIKGVGQNRFNVNGDLTRAQMAALINRVANTMGVDTTGYTHDFTDITGNSAWAYDELGWPVAAGVIKGVGGTRFNPGGNLTREQAMLIIYRAYNALKVDRSRTMETGLVTPVHEGGSPLTDYIYYDDILAYVMLDEITDHNMGDVTPVLNGAAKATTGYYSEGVNIADGSITLEGFHPENESFSVSIMVRVHRKEDEDPSLIGNKDWENGKNPGFVLAFREKDVKFNLGNGEDRMDETWSLPADYDEGWMNIILVVDRENERVGVSIDFSPLDFRSIPDSLAGVSFEGISDVCIGQDGTGSYESEFDGDVDDIIVFEIPITDNDIVKLASYYGVSVK